MRPQSCTVGEPLALVLRIMRVLSLAPLTIARERVGYRIRVYKRYAYAGYFFMILINVFHIMCKWFEINLNKKYYTEICTQIPLLIFVRLLNISVVAIITLHGSLFSASRMKNVIEQMFYMEKVIPANKDRERSNKSKIRIIFIFTCKFVIDGMNFFHYVFNMRYPDVIVIGLVLTCFKYAVVRLLRIYLFIIYEAILTKIRIVREELQDLADLLEFGFVSTSAFTQSANMSLQKIGEKLDFIKEIFTKMNQCNEYIAFFMYICMVSWIIHTAFDFIYFRPQDLQEVIFLDILNVMHITLMMMLTIEPFRGIDLEMQAMKLQVGRIATTDYVTDSIPAPLEILYDELSTMDMTFSPLGVFTMNRSLLVKTLGAAITYLLMVLQFRVN